MGNSCPKSEILNLLGTLQDFKLRRAWQTDAIWPYQRFCLSFREALDHTEFRKGSILSKPPLPFRERIRGEGDRRTDWHHALRRMCRASLASAPQHFLC